MADLASLRALLAETRLTKFEATLDEAGYANVDALRAVDEHRLLWLGLDRDQAQRLRARLQVMHGPVDAPLPRAPRCNASGLTPPRRRCCHASSPPLPHASRLTAATAV